MDPETMIADLRAQGVELVAGSIVDMAGISRAKYVPVGRLGALQRSGAGASPSWSVFTVDTAIAFTGDLGVVGDLRIRVDPADVRLLEDGIAWGPGDLTDQEGTPSPMCARSVLARVEAGLADRGLTALMGTELEATLLAPDGGRATSGLWSPYGLRTSLDLAPMLVDLARSAERAGLVVEQLHTEYGHDQIELSLAPATPVAAADAAVLARAVMGRAAARHGLRLSFSPVPFAGGAGSGAHWHLSLADADGPLFSGGEGPHGLTARGGSAIAGVIDGLAPLLGVYAGSVVSPLRLQPGNWAGAAACWGLENREAAVRFAAATAGNPHGANVELKLIDPSANPYLAAAAFLGSALRGIDLDRPLPAEVLDDPARAGVELPLLPVGQEAAIAALESSPLAADLLGAPVVAGVAAVRRHELTTYGDRPPAETTQALRLAWS